MEPALEVGRYAESSVVLVGMGSQPGGAVHVHGNMATVAVCHSLDIRCSCAVMEEGRCRETSGRILVHDAVQSGSGDGPEAHCKERKRPVDAARMADDTGADVLPCAQWAGAWEGDSRQGVVEADDVWEEHEEHEGAKQEQSESGAREGASEPEESARGVAAAVPEREQRTLTSPSHKLHQCR